MTNDPSQGVPARQARRGGAHAAPAPVRQTASQLSASLPVLEVDDIPQQTGTPVITFDHVTKVYPAQPNKPALNDISLQIYAASSSSSWAIPAPASPRSSACSSAR